MNSVSVIGLGLIGGSVCRAMKKFGTFREVVGIDSDKRVVNFAISGGIVDRGSTDLEKVIDSDLVVIATYVDTIAEIVEKIEPFLKKNCLITDVGSVKSVIVAKIESILSGKKVHFVGSHPIAGKEHSGIEHSDADIFREKKVVVTPTSKSSESSVQKVSDLWCMLGAEVFILDPETHDKTFAHVSHLPHLLAYSLVNSIASASIDNAFRYSGGSLKDFTRIAASSPEMWKTIFLQNKDSVLKSIEAFKVSLETLGSAIKNEETDQLMSFLEKASELKLSEMKRVSDE